MQETQNCFSSNCINKPETLCKCTFPATFICLTHQSEHINSSNLPHNIEPVFVNLCQDTKEAILNHLISEKANLEKMKTIAEQFFMENANYYQNLHEKKIQKIEENLVAIMRTFSVVSNVDKISRYEKDPILKSLSLPSSEALEIVKKSIYKNSRFDENIIDEGINKMVEDLVERKIKELLDGKIQINEARNYYSNISNIDEVAKKVEEIEWRIDGMEKSFKNTIENANNHIKDLKNKVDYLSSQVSENKNALKEVLKEIEKSKRDVPIAKQLTGLRRNSDILNLTESVRANLSVKALSPDLRPLKRQDKSDLKPYQIELSSPTNNKNDFLSYYSQVFEELNNRMISLSEVENKIDSMFLEYFLKIEQEIMTIDDFENFGNSRAELENELKSLKCSEEYKEKLQFICEYSSEIKSLYSNCLASYNDVAKKLEIQTQAFIEKYYKEFSFETIKNLFNIDRLGTLTKMHIYDIESHEKQQKSIDIDEPFSSDTCIVQIPNYGIFCYGNSFPLTGAACVINTNSFSVERWLPPGTPCYNSGGVYYQNSVFIFGGCDGTKILNHAEKFDLLENRWTKLSPLPFESSWCSCVAFKNSIFIAGYHLQKIYKFDIRKNEFLEISSLNLKKFLCWKILLSAMSRLYVLEDNGSIFESDELNENIWNNVGGSNFVSYNQAFRTFYNGKFYISLHYNNNMHCYSFDLGRKALEELH
ncbi:unnamed protein product [Blepharisma stoltei]|uniref:Uncharacterized protein n=1 Tax=Blepharisma stoltei TaxID=1481888 RepID=A0AAU9KDN2_9CILI|nr:unnamed protein product [Blepharisma stoltei]